MAYIYLDESGCLGFDFSKSKTSRYFLVTMLLLPQHRTAEKCIKRSIGGLHKSGIPLNTIHAYKEKPKTKKAILECLVKKECKIMTILLDKKAVFTDLKNEKVVLYNYVVNILLDRILKKKLLGEVSTVTVVASRKETSRFLNDNFKHYLESQVIQNHGIPLKVFIKKSSEEKSLQAVDVVSWSIFRKYEHNDDTYYKIIKEQIVEENGLYD